MYAKAQLIGNLGKDPTFRTIQSGKEVCNFSIATSKKINGQKVTTWWNVTSWDERKNKVIKDYVRKGDRVFVEGELISREWNDKDGNKRTSVEVDISFNGSIVLPPNPDRADGDGAAAGGGRAADRSGEFGDKPAGGRPSHWDDDLDDDVPF